MDSLRHVVFVLLSRSETKLLSLVIKAEALRILVEASETSSLLVWLDAFHLDDLGAGENVGELDWGATLFLVLNNFANAFLYRVTLRRSLIVKISLVCILVALYEN